MEEEEEEQNGGEDTTATTAVEEETKVEEVKKAVEPTPAPVSQTKTLSKKEQKKREMEELEALLGATTTPVVS